MRIALFPRSLVARVYALYALTLLVFVGAGLGIFYKFQFSQHIGEAQDSAMTVVDITAQTISDSAVIGDFDSIQHMLKRPSRTPSSTARHSSMPAAAGFVNPVSMCPGSLHPNGCATSSQMI